MAGKTDARVRYTQRALKQALLTLLKEKSVNKITVKEVCAHIICSFETHTSIIAYAGENRAEIILYQFVIRMESIQKSDDFLRPQLVGLLILRMYRF